MSDLGKFEDLKEKMLKKNEEKYGREIREKYGKYETISKDANVFLRDATKAYYGK